MPRGGRGSGGRSGGSGLFGGGSRTAPAPARAAPAPTQSSGPGMMGMIGQGMALGAGAAVGSSMVHGAMNMMSGSGSSEQQAQAPPAASPYAAQPAPVAQNNPCQEQLNQFMQCSQQNSDLSLCAPFNDIYRDCKLSHGL